jgi:hypothetical protein
LQNMNKKRRIGRNESPNYRNSGQRTKSNEF